MHHISVQVYFSLQSTARVAGYVDFRHLRQTGDPLILEQG